MVSMSGIDVKFGRIVVALLLGGGLVWLYLRYGSGTQPQTLPADPPQDLAKHQMGASNPQAEEIPSESRGFQRSELGEIVVDGTSCGTVKYVKNNVPSAKVKVLLLHGKAAKSQLWVDIGTMSNLTAWDVEAYAVDIDWEEQQKCQDVYLKEMVKQLNLKNLVIISPSLSGTLSIPFILSPEESHADIVGYVGIAPVIPPNFPSVPQNVKEDVMAKISFWYVYGENDSAPDSIGKKGLSFFEPYLPKEQVHKYKIDGAGHMCYKDKPDTWHRYLKKIIDSFDDNPKLRSIPR